MKAIYPILCIIAAVLMSSCAANYNRINPRSMWFAGETDYGEVIFAYSYDVLKQSGNTKYAKKEDKKNLQVIAVKLTNDTDFPLNVKKDIGFYAGDVPIQPIEPHLVGKQIKQNTAVYLLYGLLSFMTLNTYEQDAYGQVTTTSSFPIGLFIGPPIAILNITKASTGNKRFKDELMYNDITNRTIAPGETVYGLITIADNGHLPLSVKVNNYLSGKHR